MMILTRWLLDIQKRDSSGFPGKGLFSIVNPDACSSSKLRLRLSIMQYINAETILMKYISEKSIAKI